MPLQQAQKTTVAAVSQKQGVSVVQSYQLVQSLLLASIGSISYVRGMFDDAAFQDEEIVSERQNNQGKLMKSATVKLKILKRNVLPEVDKFMDLLENGVFECLRLGFLKSMIISVFQDRSKPNEILESYNFNFSYKSSGKDRQVWSGFEISAGVGGVANIVQPSNAQKALQQLVRRVIYITQNLGTLPDERYLTIKLFYDRDLTPENYQPLGFHDSSRESRLSFPIDSHPTNFECGNANTGWHAVDVQTRTVCAVEGDLPTPELVAATAGEPVDAEVGVVRDWGNSQLEVPESPAPSTSALASILTKMNSDVGVARATSVQPRSENINVDPISYAVKHLSILDEDLSMKTVLVVTNPLSDSDSYESQDEAEGSLQPSTEQLEGICPGLKNPIRYNEETLVKLQALARTISAKRLTGSNFIEEKERCICDFNNVTDIGGMIQCTFCNDWSHVWCYGFSSDMDERIPEKFSCYRCLFSRSHGDELEKFRDLAIFRRALMIITLEGLCKTNRDFARRLDCELETANRITQRLIQEGFIEEALSSVKSNVARGRGKSKDIRRQMYSNLRVVQSKNVDQQRELTYFNPTTDIAEFLESDVAVPLPSSLMNYLSLPHDNGYIDGETQVTDSQPQTFPTDVAKTLSLLTIKNDDEGFTKKVPISHIKLYKDEVESADGTPALIAEKTNRALSENDNLKNHINHNIYHSNSTPSKIHTRRSASPASRSGRDDHQTKRFRTSSASTTVFCG